MEFKFSADTSTITQFFPQEQPPPPAQPRPEPSRDDVDKLVRDVMQQAMAPRCEAEQQGSTTDPKHETFRDVEDLTDTAKTLYEAAGKPSSPMLRFELQEVPRVADTMHASPSCRTVP
jgi:hypothetical protein